MYIESRRLLLFDHHRIHSTPNFIVSQKRTGLRTPRRPSTSCQRLPLLLEQRPMGVLEVGQYEYGDLVSSFCGLLICGSHTVTVFGFWVSVFFCFDSFIYIPLHGARRAMAAALPLPLAGQRWAFLNGPVWRELAELWREALRHCGSAT